MKRLKGKVERGKLRLKLEEQRLFNVPGDSEVRLAAEHETRRDKITIRRTANINLFEANDSGTSLTYLSCSQRFDGVGSPDDRAPGADGEGLHTI